MVKRQIAAALAAVLAGFVIAQQDIGPCWLQGHAWNAHISEQLHNDGSLQFKTTGLNALLNHLTNTIIYKGHFLLRKQHNETTFRDD